MNAVTPTEKVAYEWMSPTLLSQQPATPPKKAKPEPKWWARLYQHVEARLAALRVWRLSWWMHWQLLATYFLPRRYVWLVVPNKTWRGQQLNNAIIDGTATLAMQTCAGGLWTGLTNPSRPWFVYGPGPDHGDLDSAGKEWYSQVTTRMEAVLQGSNFYNSTAQMFQDEVIFGTSPMLIYEDAEDVIRCYLPCAGEYYLGAGARFSDNTFYREFTLNVSEIVEMFHLENCPPEVQKLWQDGGGSWQSEFVVAQAVEVNSPLSSRSGEDDIYPIPRKFPWREVYWIRGAKDGAPLSARGFMERPFATARWTTVSNDAYGRGPGMDALGDTKQLQLMTIRQAEAVDKLARPPMGADVMLKNEPSSIRAGDVTYMDTSTGTQKKFFPLFEINAQAPGMLAQVIEKIELRIKETFFVNIFMAITQMQGVQPRNELEITKRDLERLQVLGPMIHLFEKEFAGPALDRVYAIMERRGMIPPKPPSLMNAPVRVTYISILHLAQRAAQSVSLTEALKIGAGLSSAAKAAGLPDPLRILDLDEAMREIIEMANVDPKVVFTKQQVQQADQQRAKQSQAMQMASLAPQAVDAAKNLSQTPLTGDSALAALIGSRGGAGTGPVPGVPA
jgi:hypothetical protein